MCGPALENWDGLTIDQKRVILHSFIARIEATPLECQALHLIIYWRDEESDEIALPLTGSTFTAWLKREVDTLLALIDRGASQLEIAATFPNRTWDMIAQKVRYSRGRRTSFIKEQPIRGNETFAMYQKRTNGDLSYRARTGERWKNQEETLLLSLLDSQASQPEIAQAFPHRSWARIRAKIAQMRGKKLPICGMGEIQQDETFPMYKARKAQENGATEITSTEVSLLAGIGTA
jgi:hypothetical protein